MNKLSYLVIIALLYGLYGCGSGTSVAQYIPYGGTPFTGTFSPGIGALVTGSTVNTCSTSDAESETLIFTVYESGTDFVDSTRMEYQTIFSGIFTNPVNQNNPCFTGTVSYSGCSYAQSGTISFNACTSNLFGSGYLFTAIYYLYTANGQFIQLGTVSATK